MKRKVTLTVRANQIEMLRTYYKAKKNTSDAKLIELAMLKEVARAALQLVNQSGYAPMTEAQAGITS